MKTWTYLINPFLVQRLTNKMLLEIGKSLKAALAGENAGGANIGAMLATFLVVFVPYETEYVSLAQSKGTSVGETERFNQQLTMLPEKLRHWEYIIRGVFDEKTPEYLIFFPGGRSKIYRGSLTSQFTKLQVLSNQLAKYPALAVVHTEVDAYCTSLLALQGNKVGTYTANDETSLSLEEKRIALGVEMYSILGKLISKFAADPTKVEHYFPLNLLRSSVKQPANGDEAYTLTIAAGTTEVADISFSPDDTLLISNTGDVPVYYYGAVTATQPAPATAILIAAGDEAEVTAASLGAPANRFLLLVNKDADTDGEVEITLI